MFKVCEPIGIMSHLRKMGGVYKEKKDMKLIKIPMKCPFHYGARFIMEYLYKDNNDGEYLLCYISTLHL